jgi:hypothetical protein
MNWLIWLMDKKKGNLRNNNEIKILDYIFGILF